jgi:Terminase DNA packaging enzyme
MNSIEQKLNDILEVEVVGEVITIEPEIVSVDATPEIVTPTVIIPETLPAVIEEPQERRDLEYDYEYSRTTHRDLLAQGQEALPDLFKVAKESQQPRAYEVAAGFLKTLSDMTDKLMTLHKIKKDLDGEEGGPLKNNNTLNIDKAVVYTGTTADLLKQVKESDGVLSSISNEESVNR